MKTEITDQLEDELNELKLRIAKMNARRNAQIHLLQRNLLEDSLKNKVYSKSNDAIKRNYYKYPLYYNFPSYPWKYSSIDNLLNYDPDNSIKRSVSFLSEKDLPEAYKILERRAHSNIIKRLKQFVYDQEQEITGEFVDKLLYPRKTYSPTKTDYDKDSIISKNTDTKLYPSPRESPFLKPINKSDNFYKRYNSFMKRILKPFRKPSPVLRTNDSYKKTDCLTTPINYSRRYKLPSPIPKYFPPKVNKPLSPIKSPLDDLDASYLRPWYKYSSPLYRNYLSDYEYIPKSYRVPRDVDSIIRDMEYENRRTYPFMSTYPYRSVYENDLITSSKYDPYESDSYLRSNLPTWKQYYYTQKLRSKPSHERFLDYYDPYRDFFCDAASTKSEDIGLLPKDDSEVNSLCDERSIPGENDGDDLEIIDNYRDLIYEDIIKNLRNQQTKNSLRGRTSRISKSMRTPSRSYYPNILKNDRSLYNYRITEPNPSSNYSWNKKPNFSSDYIPYRSTYNIPKTEESDKLEEKTKPFTPEKANITTYEPITLSSNKYNTDKPEDKVLNNVSPTVDEIPSPKYNTKTFNDAPTTNFNYQKYDTSPKITEVDVENKYEIPYKPLPNKIDDIYEIKPDLKTENLKDAPSTKEVFVPEKEPETKAPLRRSSIYDSKSFSNRRSPVRQQSSSQLSPKQQSIGSNPPSPVRQFPEQSTTAPVPMSRRNSIQQLHRGSIKNSSIEEEGAFPKTDTIRKFSKDQTTYYPEYGSRNSNAGQIADKNLSYANMRDSFDEKIEEKKDGPNGDYNNYTEYKDPSNIPSPKNSTESNKKSYEDYSSNQDYRTSNQFPQYNYNDSAQNPRTANSDNKYEEQPSTTENTVYQPPFQDNYHPESKNKNYNERFYDDKYNDPNSTYNYREDYQPEKNNDKQYDYPTHYDQNTDNTYNRYDPKIPEKEAPYTYSTDKRPSNELYYQDHPKPNDYDNYKNDDYNDYYRNPQNSEKRNSNYQDYRSTNRYNEPPSDIEAQNYPTNDYYSDQPQTTYRDEVPAVPQDGYNANENSYVNYNPQSRTSFENYSTEKEVPYSGQNSYENPDYEPDSSVDKIPQTSENTGIKELAEETTPIIESTNEQKVKDRKKSLAVESVREPEPTTVPEPIPKEVPSSRRTSKTATSLAEERRKLQAAERAKLAKTKPAVEPKFKRTPSIKSKTLQKRT